MIYKIKYIICFILLLQGFKGSAQSDTIILKFDDFLRLVKQNHPVAKQADIITKSADAATQSARGSFDPKLFYQFDNKNFDSKNYFELANGGFMIPTWYGIEIKGGLERNQGVFLNPENNVPNQGLLYSQVSFPLLKGLFIDERRATLRSAKVFQSLSEFEKLNVLNELLYQAGKAYWDWQFSYNNLLVLQNAVTIGQIRLEAVIKTSVLGDRPSIDTVEATIQLQDRIVNLQQGQMEYKTKSLKLSNYLWLENDVPIELTNLTTPEINTSTYENENRILFNLDRFDSLINSHPNLRIYDFKLQQLAIERRYKAEMFKPRLNLNYNPLFDRNNDDLNFRNNYKWGFSFDFPILLRKEQGDLKLTKLKIKTTTFESLNKRNELINKTKAAVNEFNTYKAQINVYTQNVSNYERLWQSEKRLFDSGESSLFMINSREMSYINAQIKLNEIIYKHKKAALEAEYSFGYLNSNY